MSNYTPHCYVQEATDGSGTTYYKLSVWVDVPSGETIDPPTTQTLNKGSYQLFEAVLPVVDSSGAPADEKRFDFDIYLTANDRYEVQTKKGGTIKNTGKGSLADADSPD